MKVVCLFLYLLVFSSAVFAGQDGNGGFAVLCEKSTILRNSNMPLSPGIYTLDYVEALSSKNVDWNLGSGDLPWRDKLKIVVSRLARVNTILSEELADLIAHPERKITLSDETIYCSNDLVIGSQVQYSIDIGGTIVPAGCNLIPVARNLSSCDEIDESLPLIFIFKSHFEKMSEDSKAALVLHEFLYKKWGVQGNSKIVRRTLGFLASSSLDVLSFETAVGLMHQQTFIKAVIRAAPTPIFLHVNDAKSFRYSLQIVDGEHFRISYSGAIAQLSEFDSQGLIFVPEALGGPKSAYTFTVSLLGQAKDVVTAKVDQSSVQFYYKNLEAKVKVEGHNGIAAQGLSSWGGLKQFAQVVEAKAVPGFGKNSIENLLWISDGDAKLTMSSAGTVVLGINSELRVKCFLPQYRIVTLEQNGTAAMGAGFCEDKYSQISYMDGIASYRSKSLNIQSRNAIQFESLGTDSVAVSMDQKDLPVGDFYRPQIKVEMGSIKKARFSEGKLTCVEISPHYRDIASIVKIGNSAWKIEKSTAFFISKNRALESKSPSCSELNTKKVAI